MVFDEKEGCFTHYAQRVCINATYQTNAEGTHKNCHIRLIVHRVLTIYLCFNAAITSSQNTCFSTEQKKTGTLMWRFKTKLHGVVSMRCEPCSGHM